MSRMLAWRGVCIALACVAAVVAQEIDYRIPRNLLPEHYDVEIRADFYPPLQPSQFFLDGWVTVHLRCVTPSNLIHLHFRSMTIDQSSVVVTEGENPAITIESMSIDSVREFFIIEMSRDCRENEHITVSMNYTGPIRNDGVGLYYSQYNDTGVVKYMVSTQFETTDARKAFPCMDEPSFKSTFQASLWHKDPLVALTNTPNVTEDDPGFGGWKITRFERTNVVMVTYLVAFIIADYEYLDDITDTNFGGETETRQWARHDAVQSGQLDYSQEISTSMLEYLELHYNHSYIPVKLDQVSVPDFVSGAMENWGLVTYRETRHIVDPDYCGGYEIDRLTYTVAHENVHMWLGNVVTCDWWSELWIQEGHANFYEHRTAAYVQPNWDTQQTFVVRVLFAALRADDNGNEHPLYVPVASPADSDMVFSTISYDKGASVIRMVEQLFLNHDSYQRAIRSYIDEHQYKTATHEDLVRAWDTQATIDGLNLPVNVTEAALTWIRQTGFPVIKLTVTGGTNVEITQKMLLEWPDRPLREYYPSPYSYTWFVPVSYSTSNAPNTMNIEWLRRDNRTMTLSSSIGTTGWILGNYHGFGFYRVNYDNNTWRNLISQLNIGHEVFNVSNRALLIHDSNALGKCGEIHHVIGLQTTEYMFRENQWAPWYALDQSFSYVSLMLSETVSFGKYKTYLQNQVNSIYNSLGWDDVPGEPIETVHLRALAIDVACKHEHVACLNSAWSKFSAWRNAPYNLTIIRPDIRRAVICAALSRSLTDSWDFVFSQYQLPWQGPDNVDRPRLRSALACSTDRAILNSYFTMGATADPRIHPNDRTAVMTAVAGTPIGNEVAWDYLSLNWNAMSTSGRLAALETVVQRYSTSADKYALEQFFLRYPAQNEDEQARYDQMIRNVDANIRWQATNYAEVAGFLNRVVPSDAQSILSFSLPKAAKQDEHKSLYDENAADWI